MSTTSHYNISIGGNTMDEQVMKQIALIRYGKIAPLINETHGTRSKSAYFRLLSKSPCQLPSGESITYSAGTYKSWYLDYMKGGFDALFPKTRADIGKSRTLDYETITRIYELKEKYPYITATMTYQKLLDEQFITASSTSLSTITRFISKNGLKSVSDGRERKSFEMEHANDCWQADTSHAVVLNIKGEKYKTYLILFLDDASRMVTGFGFFFNDNAINMQGVFKKAIAKYGKPKRLYVDNGGPYKNEQLAMICASLGIALINTHPYDPKSKGKVERIFRTIKDQWMRASDWNQYHSLEDLNKDLEEFMNKKYLNNIHSAIKTSPKERYMKDQELIKYIPIEDLNEHFLHREERKVKSDATIPIKQIKFEVPQQYIGTRIHVRFDPNELEKAYIYKENERKEIIYPLKRVDNAKVKRNGIEFSSKGGEQHEL